MRIHSIATVVLLCLAGLVVPATSASASTGGGCSLSAWTGTGQAQYKVKACAQNGGWARINSDAYIYFSAANPGLWTNCSMYMALIDLTTKSKVVDKSIDCTLAARENKWGENYSINVWPTSGHSYETQIKVTAYYEGRYTGYTYQWSPTITW
ncbi:hypothetical protein [Nonomuraea sp. B19D2]|uniref:hypothetical protein n=1 Tax=Nonomuraea sp. B19D2 TaxID=3159561 RepID=UPI0032DA4170